jgi:hypothetical protein
VTVNKFDKVSELNRSRQAQAKVIDAFAKEKPGGIQMYDFGDSVLAMPVPNFEGSYLTRSICVLVRVGEGTMQYVVPFERSTKIVEFPNGWKFLGVEFGPTTSPDELQKMLDAAKDQLLAAP